MPIAIAPAAQAGIYCDPGWTYAVTSNTTNTMHVVDRTSVTNSTGSTKVNATFKADQAGTFSATASISLTAEASAAVSAKVSATVNSAITHSMTTTIGTSTTADVKPYSTLKADYGIVRENVSMKKYYMYSNCQTSSPTYFTYAAPYRKNWKLYY
ncbi:MAG: hypothetical protein WB441_10495 [Nocardioidaceae bacterium]